MWIAARPSYMFFSFSQGNNNHDKVKQKLYNWELYGSGFFRMLYDSLWFFYTAGKDVTYEYVYVYIYKVRRAWVCVQGTKMSMCTVQGTSMSLCARYEYEYVCKVRVWVCVQYACEEFTYFAHSLSQEKNMLNFWPDCSAQLLSQSNLISSYS